jgi:hypothetical protein
MHTFGNIKIQLYALLTLAPEGEWSASGAGRFILREIAPSTHCIQGLVDSRASLDAVKRNAYDSNGNRTPIPLSSSPKPGHLLSL